MPATIPEMRRFSAGQRPNLTPKQNHAVDRVGESAASYIENLASSRWPRGSPRKCLTKEAVCGTASVFFLCFLCGLQFVFDVSGDCGDPTKK
jgi:hypothetical protein